MTIAAMWIAVAMAHADSATVTLKPHDANAGTIKWIAFDDARKPVGRGVTPGTVQQATQGVAVTYCTDTPNEWLEVVVDVEGGKGRMTAFGKCTRVLVNGKATQTLGVDDPREASHAKGKP